MLMLMITSLFGRPIGALALLSALALCNVARAQSVMYKCVDGNGAVLYTDTLQRNCKALDLPSSGTTNAIAAPARRATAARAPAATAPADFPKVGGAQQRARDDDRREILNDELRSEEKKLADLRRDFNGGEPERQGNERNYAKYQERVVQMKDSIGRAEKNIDALKREIGNIK
jgi:hypothetical protein